ncbi:hypothetical protein [Aquipuribacter sp. MA13-6]|uniref:hypothetical protein n=1 Tax=unclassified Aquipuribacter TaxID=2635084 RepID=UPI003EE8A7AA
MPELDDGLLRGLIGDEPFERARSHDAPEVLQRKRDAVAAEHVKPFESARNDMLGAMSRAGVKEPEAHLPRVDPASGGVHARLVVLTEAPSASALESAGGSGFASTDNDDPISERMWRLCGDAGLERYEVVHWNCIAWDKSLKLERALVRAFLRRWLQVMEGPSRVVLLSTAAKGFRTDVRAGLPEAEITDVLSSSSRVALSDPRVDAGIVAALRGW